MYLKADGYKVKESDITIVVGTKTKGYGSDEHTEAYFEGVRAVVNK